MKLIINCEDDYDIEAVIRVDKRGFALIEEFANGHALPPQAAQHGVQRTARKRRAKKYVFDPRDVSILGGDPSL